MKRTLLIIAILALLPACGQKQDEDVSLASEKNAENLNAVLLEAADDGDLEKVRGTILEGADVNAADQHGMTPLHLAASSDNQNLMRLLIRKGASVSAKDSEDNTPLHKAFGPCSLGLSVEVLLTRGADPNAKNRSGETPLHLAVMKMTWRAVDQLVCAGAHINTKDNSGSTPLDKAVRGFYPEVILYLREKGAKAGKTARNIFEAVKYGDIERVKQFVADGADVNTRDNPRKNTPLHYAAMLNYIEVARILVDAGAKIDSLSHRTGRPLHRALIGGHEEMARFLVDKGADTRKRCRQWRESANTCLHLAAASGKPGLVTLMLDSGLEVDVRDHWLRTPLHDAVIHGHRQVVELLIARGADVNAVRAVLLPDKGIMPLDIALHRKHSGIAQLLRSRGAKRWDDLSEEERKEKSKILKDFKP